jgi:hypothetical protein
VSAGLCHERESALAAGHEPGWSFDDIEEARDQATRWLRDPVWNKGEAIQAVTIHEPAEFGDMDGHLETLARNKVAADRAKTQAFRRVFGGRSPGEVVYDAAGVKPKPKVNPGDTAGPVGRTSRFQVGSEGRPQN